VRRVGGSAPAEGINVWQFDATTPWYLDFLCVLRGYGGGGLTFTLPWTAATATTGVTRWRIGIRRQQVGVDDSDTAHTYVYTSLDATAPATSGMLAYSEVALTNGANMDGWVTNEQAIVRVGREAAHANDSMAGFAELWGVPWGRET
jgi:hypothetical protein